jgi:hypothetical protein
MAYRQLPTPSRRIGFEIQTPSEVEIQTGEVVCCREKRANGQTIGELEVRVFHAALLIDRDGILEEKMEDAVNESAEPGSRVMPPIPVAMPGASGLRADIVVMQAKGGVRPALPYVYVFAMAPNDLALDGGLIVTVRSASPEWPAADKILRSLKILSRRGASANDVGDAAPMLPLLGQRDDD